MNICHGEELSFKHLISHFAFVIIFLVFRLLVGFMHHFPSKGLLLHQFSFLPHHLSMSMSLRRYLHFSRLIFPLFLFSVDHLSVGPFSFSLLYLCFLAFLRQCCQLASILLHGQMKKVFQKVESLSSSLYSILSASLSALISYSTPFSWLLPWFQTIMFSFLPFFFSVHCIIPFLLFNSRFYLFFLLHQRSLSLF